MFNTFAVSADGTVTKKEVTAFLTRHGADTEDEVGRILASYTASPPG